jgi:hypothetical protein
MGLTNHISCCSTAWRCAALHSAKCSMLRYSDSKPSAVGIYVIVFPSGQSTVSATPCANRVETDIE